MALGRGIDTYILYTYGFTLNFQMTTSIGILFPRNVETWQHSRQVRQLVLWIHRTEICCRKGSLADFKELSIRTGRARWDVKSDRGRERKRYI
jgi:hypothetical protein